MRSYTKIIRGVLQVKSNKKVCSYNVNFRVGAHFGGTLGKPYSNRDLRNVANFAYLNYKIPAGIIHIPKIVQRSKLENRDP